MTVSVEQLTQKYRCVESDLALNDRHILPYCLLEYRRHIHEKLRELLPKISEL